MIAEIERLRAALIEACDIADRYIFTPTGTVGVAAAGPHFATAQPLNAGESFKLIPGTGTACAAGPSFSSQAFTIDTGTPYRDKARIAELRRSA